MHLIWVVGQASDPEGPGRAPTCTGPQGRLAVEVRYYIFLRRDCQSSPAS